MHSQIFNNALLLASSLLGLAQAKPHFRVSARDLYVEESCQSFGLGKNAQVIGKVCASIVEGTMYVKFGELNSGLNYTNAHVWVGTSPPVDGTPDRAPGRYPYTTENGNCTLGTGALTAQCKIKVESGWRACDSKLYLVTHSTIGNITSGSEAGTAWGGTVNDCWNAADKQGNCPKYWSITRMCYCKSTIFPAPSTIYATYTSTWTTTSTTEYLTSTTSTYLTSTTSTYVTSTTVEFDTSTTIQYSTTEYDTKTITSTTTTTTTSTPAPITTQTTCALAS